MKNPTKILIAIPAGVSIRREGADESVMISLLSDVWLTLFCGSKSRCNELKDRDLTQSPYKTKKILDKSDKDMSNMAKTCFLLLGSGFLAMGMFATPALGIDVRCSFD
jgi:hypothetical protein